MALLTNSAVPLPFLSMLVLNLSSATYIWPKALALEKIKLVGADGKA